MVNQLIFIMEIVSLWNVTRSLVVSANILGNLLSSGHSFYP